MKQYVAHLGGALARALGAYFGSTIDSIYSDSFEIFPLPGTVLWSNDTLEEFNQRKGYNLAPYLPAIWWEIGGLTRAGGNWGAIGAIGGNWGLGAIGVSP